VEVTFAVSGIALSPFSTWVSSMGAHPSFVYFVLLTYHIASNWSQLF
jgi:hypothetical protein